MKLNPRNEAILEDLRLHRLNSAIRKLYEHLDPDKIDLLASEFDESRTTMIEFIQVDPAGSFAMDLFEEIEFKPLDVPSTLIADLRRTDAFLATLGKRQGRWQVVYLSSPYEEETYEESVFAD